MEILVLNRHHWSIFVPTTEALPRSAALETLSAIDQITFHVSTEPKNS
jgi:hypothetical protein